MSRPGRPEGRYLLHRVLGEGGSGRVWLVEDRLRPGSPVALKELSAAGPADARHEESLRREFATLACLRHPNLVEVHEFDTSPQSGLPRFTLEFIAGRDLVQAIAHEGPAKFLDLAAEALRALAFLHDFDVIHGDLKPANVLVRDRPKLGCRLVLVDFGFAAARRGDSLEVHRARGTLPYMAPEVLRGERPSPRSDLYALGAVLHEAIFGRPPLRPTTGGDLTRFIRDVTEGKRSRPPLPAGYREGCGDWLGELLSPDAAERPARAVEALARLNQACGTAYPAETPVSRAARLLSGPPAERRDAIAAVWDALDPSAGPRVVWLCGDPGAGKTRMLRWLEAEGIQRGWQVVVAGPDSRPSLADLRADAARGPTLVLLDDLEAAGAATLELVDRIARDSHGPPLQVVGALEPGRIRQPALRKLYSDTGTVPTLREVTLGRLDEPGVRAMASRATGGAVSDERVQWLLRASEGSPARAESLLIAAAWERGDRRAAAAGGEVLLPEGRLEMLSRPALAWLDALAILRWDAGEAHLVELCGLEPATAHAAAEEASTAGLAYRKGNRWYPESRILLEHLRSRMEPERHRALHRRAAELLEAAADPGADPWLLSALWSDAGAPGLAAEYAVRAARAARAANDPAEAAARYGQALRLLGHTTHGRHEIRSRQAQALMDAGIHAAAARAWGAVVRLCRTPPERGRALAGQALALVQAGRFERGLRSAEEAARLAAAAEDGALLARAKKAAGIALGRLGRETEAIPLLEQAGDLLHGRGEVEDEAEILQILATCKLRLGRKEAEGDFTRALELYRAAEGEGARSARALKAVVGLAVIRARSGQHERATELLQEVRAAAVEQGNLALQEAAISKLAVVAIDRGDLDRAMVLAEQAADLARHLGDHNLILVNRCRLADARIRCGRPGEAMALLREALDRPLSQVEPENVDYARMLLAEAWLESGRGDENVVRNLLEESLSRCRGRPKRRALLAALVIEMERRARPHCLDPFPAVELEFEAALERSDELLDAEIGIRAHLARAAYRLRQGDPEAARAEAERAAELARAGSAVAFEARARALLADALERLGHEEDARHARRAARRLLDDAAERIADEEARADFLARPVFESLRREDSPAGRRNQSRLLALYDMIRALNSESDPDALLESILDMALRAVRAERGMIFLKEGRDGEDAGEPAVHVARDLEKETIHDVESYSRGIVAAAEAGQSLLVIDAAGDERVRRLESISLYGIRSLMCVPLRSRGKMIGTVYLDSRRKGVLFTRDDLRFIEAFADHAALALENTRARARLERHNRRLQAAVENRTGLGNLVGSCPAMQAVFDLVEKVAATDLPVLIRGESGTGKELVAQAIHYHGPRRRNIFVSVNCAAIPESLLESELFGHVRGAFTGAERDRRGLFEQAHRGTLLLDEVGDMSSAMQARLLRVLEEGRVRRVGGEKAIEIDVRVLAATHRDLRAEVEAGRFREDLLYRLRVLTIELPPLRERRGDVPLLVSHFLRRIAEPGGRPPQAVTPEALTLLEAHTWPGNVRELDNTLRHLSLLAGDGPIGVEVMESDPQLRRALVRDARSREPVFSLKHGEREQILRAIDAAGGNRVRAAGLLGVSRATLYRKLKQHGL